MDVMVTRTVALTAEVIQVFLSRPDGKALPAFEAGAHVMVTVAPGITRAYSLCGDPADTGEYVIAVKRESAGRGGSQALHARACAGMTFSIGAPHNLFALAGQAPHHLLIAGGIGITPLVAMAHALHRRREAFSLLAFSRSRALLPFAELLNAGSWKDRVATYFNDTPRADLAAKFATMPTGTHVLLLRPGWLHASDA